MNSTFGRPPKFSSPEEFETLAEGYFLSCENEEGRITTPITITGLALHLGTTRETLRDYEAKPDFSDAVKRAKLRVEQFAEEQLYIGKNAAGPIFALKNFGWRDAQDVNLGGQEGQNPVKVDATVTLDPSEAYRQMLGDKKPT